MAKIYGLFGSMTGKLADTVMSVRNGEQIARKYQPVVFNPSTPAQVAQRAKLKLLSQLSAVLAPAIAMPRDGSVSSRNKFTKMNFGLTTFADNQADISLASVKLTAGIVGFPSVAATRSNNKVSVALQAPAYNFDKVVYVTVAKQDDKELRFLGTTVSDIPGPNFDFEKEISLGTNGPIVLYAYGIRFNTESARTKYGDITAEQAETVAKLICNRILTESDITLSETIGKEVDAFSE